MYIVVDTRTGLVMEVGTGEGPVTLGQYKEGQDPNDFGQMEYDYD